MRNELVYCKKLKKGWFGNGEGESFTDNEILVAHKISQMIDDLNLKYLIFITPDREVCFDFQIDPHHQEKNITLDVDFGNSSIFIHSYNLRLNQAKSQEFDISDINSAISFLKKMTII